MIITIESPKISRLISRIHLIFFKGIYSTQFNGGTRKNWEGIRGLQKLSVSLAFVEPSFVKASKRNQKSRFVFYPENTNPVSVDDQSTGLL